MKNWSLQSAKALVIRELAAAEESEMDALRHLRNVGEEWINIKDALGERGINIAEWCRANMPVTRQWLDRHAELFKHWKEFLAARKWAAGAGYASRRQSGLEYALELIAAKDRSELLMKESRLAFDATRKGFTDAQTDTSSATVAARGIPIILNKATTLFPGDCREVLKNFPDKTIDLVIADPPYFLRQKDWSQVDDLLVRNGMTPRLRETWDEFDDLDAYLEFTNQWLEQAMRVLTDEGSLFAFGTYHCTGLMNYVMQRREIPILHHIVWLKHNSKPNLSTRRLQLSNETIIWAVKSDNYRFHYAHTKAADYPNDFFKKQGKQLRDVWDIPVAPHESCGHPSQKPVAIYDRLLDVAGLPGGLLLDPFAGSGTAAVAAGDHGMRSILIEREPKYVEIIRRRVAATGKGRRQALNDDGLVPEVAAD
jgi:DNA modification methylase